MRDIEKAGLASTSSVYDIEEKILRGKGEHARCPRTGRTGCAYIDTVTGEDNVGRSTHMLSYAWSYQVQDIVDTLSSFCQEQGLDPKRTYVWICCFGVNQHCVKDAAVVPFGTFKEQFRQQVRNVGHILAMMAPWDSPEYIRRMWCVFEFSAAMAEGKQVTVVMPPRENGALLGALMAGRQQRVFDALSAIRIQDAHATHDNDKTNILKTIDPNTQDYNMSLAVAVVNAGVRDKLQSWFLESAAGCLERQLNQGARVDLQAICATSKLLIESTIYCGRACALLEEGLIHATQTGTSYALALMWLGRAHCVHGDNHLAFRYYAQAKAAYKCAGTSKGLEYSMLLLHTGMAHYDCGDNELALRAYEEATVALDAAGDAMIFQSGRVLCCRGLVHRTMGKPETALSCFAEATAAYESVGAVTGPSYADLFDCIGRAHYELGDIQEALRHFARAKAIFEASGLVSHRCYAEPILNIGICCRDQGDIQGALRNYARARAVLDAAGQTKRHYYARLLANIGVARRDQGDIKAALHHYAQAEKIYVANGVGRGPEYPGLLQKIAEAHLAQGEFEATSCRYAQAKDAFDGADATKSFNDASC